MKTNYGGPAFPVKQSNPTNNSIRLFYDMGELPAKTDAEHSGMSLRD